MALLTGYESQDKAQPLKAIVPAQAVEPADVLNHLAILGLSIDAHGEIKPGRIDVVDVEGRD